jgi:hypothetical protein
MDKVRKWCNCQVKCREDTPYTWTCTIHLAEGHSYPCRANPAKVRVRSDGYYQLEGCPDFQPPGYDCNDPNLFTALDVT